MEKSEFDKRFLTLVNQSNVVITVPNIAYNLDIPIEEAQEHMLSLELNGVLTQQTDAQTGDTIYVMPNRPVPGAVPSPESEQGNNQGPPGVHNPADLPPAPVLSQSPSAAPAKAQSVNGLVLNAIIPGVGSLVCGKMIGLAMLGLLFLGLIFLFMLPGFSKVLAVVPVIAAWIWSIIAGVQLLNDRETPHTRSV
ncbi:MAG: hypothetical protein JRH20_03865 [Deltaproteobacteria bacterium]|nr:hypothetical protein [Deltaproteobacteria bacterium]